MRITADTNLLVRVVTGDNLAQSRTAHHILASAELVAIPLPALCEFVWVLEFTYRYSAEQVIAAVRAIMDAPNAVVDTTAVEAGLAVQAEGGDFADAVIAQSGQSFGGSVFVSFDRRAVDRIAKIGLQTAHAESLI